MHPNNYFGLFPPFPRDNRVFVAMSFDQKFESRYNKVIAPAIDSVCFRNKPLHAHRVDSRHISDSILTEILDNIGRARLILADITSVGPFEGKPYRNANVLYEIGLAHSVRIPEEVLLFRSDLDPLLFDVANIRVNSYDPDNKPSEAIQQIGLSIVEALRSIDQKKSLAVRSVAEALDVPSLVLLVEASMRGEVRHRPVETFGQALGNAAQNAAIARLLELGTIRTEYVRFTGDNILEGLDQPLDNFSSYRITPFGQEVVTYIYDKMGFLDEALVELAQQLINDKRDEGEKKS